MIKHAPQLFLILLSQSWIIALEDIHVLKTIVPLPTRGLLVALNFQDYYVAFVNVTLMHYEV